MYALWLENVNKDAPVKFVPGKGSRVCSKHFSSDMFKEGKQKTILKHNAVPTIFNNSQVSMFLFFLKFVQNWGDREKARTLLTVFIQNNLDLNNNFI